MKTLLVGALSILSIPTLIACGESRSKMSRSATSPAQEGDSTPDRVWRLEPTDAIQSLTAYNRDATWKALRAFFAGATSASIHVATQSVDVARARIHLADRPAEDCVIVASVPTSAEETHKAFSVMSALAAWLQMMDVTSEIHYGGEVLLDPRVTVRQVERAAAEMPPGCIVAHHDLFDALVVSRTCGGSRSIVEIGRAGSFARTLSVFNLDSPLESARDLQSLLQKVYARPVRIGSIPANPFSTEIK